MDTVDWLKTESETEETCHGAVWQNVGSAVTTLCRFQCALAETKFYYSNYISRES